MICWYCYWGWAKQVAEIYKNAVLKLNGDESPLHFGPSHIVWEDENFEDNNIKWCLDHFDEYKHGYSENDLSIVKWSLVELIKIPEKLRVCPKDYDDEHPELYPPTFEVIKV